MKAKKGNVTTLEEFKDKHYGKSGTARRDKFEAGYKNFKIGALLYEARLEKGLTQSELAEKVGTTKSYICLLYTSPSPRDGLLSRMPSSA